MSPGSGRLLPPVDVVIVSYESAETLGATLRSVAEQQESVPVRVTVVDNASRDGSSEVARRVAPAARVVENPRNTGFAAACNRGWLEGRGAAVLFLNPDATLQPGALAALLDRLASADDVGIVGPRTRNVDGTVQVSTGPDLSLVSERRQRALVRGVQRRLSPAMELAERLHATEHTVDWVSGSCLLARRECLQAVGGWDEGFFLYEEDADLCRRARQAGWKVLFAPAAEAVHHLGRSAARAPHAAALEYHRSHLRYYRKHAGALDRLGLRLLVGGRGAATWVGGLARADRQTRAHGASLLRLALAEPS